MSERIAREVMSLGLENKAVVIGSGSLDAEIRPAHDIDMAVDAETYRDLRETYGWTEAVAFDGQPLLQKDNFEVAVGWGPQTTEELKDRAFKINDVAFASLPDIYAWKQEKSRDKDIDDLALIRDRLYDRPLPLSMLDRELQFLRDFMPEETHFHPALAVAANGLHIVRTIFGESRNRLHIYSGLVETGDVLAGYHIYGHSAGGAERVARHAAKHNQARLALGQTILFTPNDTLAAVTGFAYHDSYMGDGRESDDPHGYDEKRSADMAARHLEIAGCTQDNMPNKTRVGGLATGFNEITKRQDIDPSRGYLHIQEANAGADLDTFDQPEFIDRTIRLCVEDLTRVGAGFDRPLGKKADELGIRIGSIHEALALIDTDRQLQLDFATRLEGSGNFCQHYKSPDGWSLDNLSVRAANAAFAQNLAKRVKQGHISAAEAYALSQEHILTY